MVNRVVLVKAFFETESQKREPKVANKKLDGWFATVAEVNKKEVQQAEPEFTVSKIDSARLAQDLEIAINKLTIEGYVIQNILPVISGAYDYLFKTEEITSSLSFFTGNEKVFGGASFGFGFGYSYTDSLIIIARKIASE